MVILSSCGAPGDPLPPLLNIPARTTDLEIAQRAGDLILRWTIPSSTTESVPVRDLDRVVVWGLDLETGAEPAVPFGSAARELDRLPAPKPGERTERRLALPAPPGRRLALAVENLNRRGRSEGLSNVVVVEIAAAPQAPRSLRAAAGPAAIRLEWPAVSAAAGYRVFRAVEGKAPFAPLGEVAAPPFEDADYRWGARYAYFVRAFVTTSTGSAESADSPVAELVPEDTFAPAPPEGLRAVPTEFSVELSWNPSPESDAAGYHVYRRDAAGEWARVSASPLAGPTFTDKDVRREQQYSYAVSALDVKGNESPRSTAVTVTIP